MNSFFFLFLIMFWLYCLHFTLLKITWNKSMQSVCVGFKAVALESTQYPEHNSVNMKKIWWINCCISCQSSEIGWRLRWCSGRLPWYFTLPYFLRFCVFVLSFALLNTTNLDFNISAALCFTETWLSEHIPDTWLDFTCSERTAHGENEGRRNLLLH